MKRFALAFSLSFALILCVPAWGQAAYGFRTINYPNDPFTQLLGINNSLTIAGYHNFNQNSGFTLRLPFIFTTENFPGSMMTQVIGISNNGVTDGFYFDMNGVTHGFFNKMGTYTTVDNTSGCTPPNCFNQLLGQNDLGIASGYYSQSQNNTTPDIPYTYDENMNTFTVITISGSPGGAQATGVNNEGQVCGFYIDAMGTNHGFLLNGSTLTTLDAPGSTFTQALGLNNKGQVVGDFMDQMGATHGFVWTSANGFKTIDDPNGIGTTIVNGINDHGDLVGFYGTAPINSGFIAFPL